jgi:hypothetical protein
VRCHSIQIHIEKSRRFLFLQFYNAETSVSENKVSSQENILFDKSREDSEKDQLSFRSISTDEGILERGKIYSLLYIIGVKIQ